MIESTDIDTATAAAAHDTAQVDAVPEPKLSYQPVLPGEIPADKEQLRIALMAEFAPKTPYQRRLAHQLVEYEWEIDRHRRLRDLSILGRYHERAIAVLKQQHKTEPFKEKLLSSDELMLARDLVGPIKSERVKAEKDLVDLTFWEPEHLLAMAAGDCPAANAHEARIRDLERRRVVLRKELEELKKTSKAPVEDAEIIEAET
jgi:hypothetical protein